MFQEHGKCLRGKLKTAKSSNWLPLRSFEKQTVGNACGTIGLLHALGNITSEIKLGKLTLFTVVA
ncbi:uncharacterized protein DS421_4g123550 [Arachis hypogaea]|nr:uncharacterized protein DS421_4g123550 [Arachis hypogaea]